MTLGSGMISGPKHHYHLPRAPQQYLTTPPDFVRLLSLYGIAISTLMQLEPYLGYIYIIIIIIVIIIIFMWNFCQPALIDVFLLKSEWQHISSSALHISSKYPSWF